MPPINPTKIRVALTLNPVRLKQGLIFLATDIELRNLYDADKHDQRAGVILIQGVARRTPNSGG